MIITHCKVSFLSTMAALLLSSVNAQDCQPTNCITSCSPDCADDQVCTITTMTSCGVCPVSVCASKAQPGISPFTNTAAQSKSSSPSGGLIGGIVGGVLVLVIALVATYYFIRRRRKNSQHPLPFNRNIQNHNTPIQHPQSVMEERYTSSIHGSGIIPVTFIPPVYDSALGNRAQLESQASHYGSFATQSRYSTPQDDDNPFNDRPLSNALSILTQTTATRFSSRRGSEESNRNFMTVVQATQVMRAKPQVMRVNTVQVKNALGTPRSDSTKKTIQLDAGFSGSINRKVITPDLTAPDDPFDDRNKVDLRASTSSGGTKLTNSLLSAPGEGEITIFWNAD